MLMVRVCPVTWTSCVVYPTQEISSVAPRGTDGSTKLPSISVIAPVVMGQVVGFGVDSYLAALDIAVRKLGGVV